jgi:hypothetical protein
MLTPTVTEISRATEPVVQDTFITEFAQSVQREQSLPANVIRLSSHRSQRGRPAIVPSRVA